MGQVIKLVVGVIFIGLVFTGLSAFLGESILNYNLQPTDNETVGNVYSSFQNISTYDEVTDLEEDITEGSDSWLNGTFLEGVWYSWQDTSFYKIGSALRTASGSYKIAGDMVESSATLIGIDPRFINGFKVSIILAVVLLIAGILFKRRL